MSILRATKIFTLLLIVAIAVYDVFAISKGGAEASISHLLIDMSYRFPAFTFLVGFVAGHLFWRMGDTTMTQKHSKDNKE